MGASQAYVQLHDWPVDILLSKILPEIGGIIGGLLYRGAQGQVGTGQVVLVMIKARMEYCNTGLLVPMLSVDHRYSH